MKLLITGSNGLLGQKLVQLLSQDPGIQVIATSKGKNRLSPGNYNFESMDITNADAVMSVFSSIQPELVIHCAAMTQVDDCELAPERCALINIQGTKNVIKASIKVGAYIEYVSTDFVFDGTKKNLTELDEPNPISIYGRSKLEAERLIQESGLSSSIVRTVLVYGVAQDPSRSNIVLWVKKKLENNESIRVVTDQWRTPTLAEDLALGCWQVAQHKEVGIWHISGNEGISPYQLAVKTAQHFHLDPHLITPVDASTFTQPGKRPPLTGFDIAKAINKLNFKPHSFEQGLQIIENQIKYKIA